MPDDFAYAPFSIARREDGSRVELGRGAMGITYKATDTQLGRTVALKVINATYLGDPIARQRFLAEARAAAQLQHANVASVYHLRAEGEDIFYAMEFVDGETVDAYVRRRGPLPSRLALRIILQAAQGLAAANERGLIHRDIKPANLMLARAPAPAGEGIEHEEEDGLLVKVIDFGLAKTVVANETGGGLTGGSVVGTPYFMSPEQISLESGSTLDCRSDIYSLGVTLWYMLTGRAPFGGTQFQILSQHLQKRPPLETLSEAGVSAEVVALIGSMLAKDREERPANHPALIAALKKLLRLGGTTTTSAVTRPGAEALEDGTTVMPVTLTPVRTPAIPPRASRPWWKTALPVGVIAVAAALALWRPWHAKPEAAVAGNSKSVAVLPFVNMSADKNDEYLSDGMTEELLNLLAKVKGLRVPGRTSSFAFKGRTEDGIFRKVGEELQVKTVLEGSVRKVGDKLRITAQLINVADGYHLWSETYDGDMKDILAMQSDVAQRVVRALQVQLGVDEVRALARTPTQNPEAYRLYLLGRHHFAKFTQAGWTNAIRYFEQALQVDPNYALAYCGLADTYGWCGGQIFSGREAWAKEKELALKALAIDPNLADAHLSLGVALFSALEDLPASDRELDRALELNPKLALAYDQYGWNLMAYGRYDQALAMERKALELDPLNPLYNGDLGYFLQWARRYDEAIVQLRKTLELDGYSAFAHNALGWCFVWKSNLAGAVAEFQEATKLDYLPLYLGGLGYAYAAMDDRAKAEQVLRDLDELARKQYVSPSPRVSIYLGLGEKAKALDWLEKCFAEQDPTLFWINGDQLFDSVRTEPRFQAMLKKSGLNR